MNDRIFTAKITLTSSISHKLQYWYTLRSLINMNARLFFPNKFSLIHELLKVNKVILSSANVVHLLAVVLALTPGVLPIPTKKVVVFGFFGQLWQHGMTKWHGNWYRYVLLYCKQVLSWIWFILRSFWGTYGPKCGNLDLKMCRIWWFLLYCGHICGQNDLKFGTDIVWHMPHKFY